MLRSLFVTMLLTGFVLATCSASVAVASDARQALNIGFVLYTKGNVPGTLNARWTYQNTYSGKGLADGRTEGRLCRALSCPLLRRAGESFRMNMRRRGDGSGVAAGSNECNRPI